MKNINPQMTPSQKLLALIAHGLQSHAKASTESQLGDRTQYIGMSDIGLMQECPRLAVLRKVKPTNDQHVTLENYHQILKKQLTLQRGHWLEDGIANALYANDYKLIPQLEICVHADKAPIKIHLDFVIVGENCIRILELKSNANLSNQVPKSYEMQIQGQVSLLHQHWSEPVFNLKDANGVLLYENKTFPEICKLYLGVNLSERDCYDLQGWLLCISMNEAKTFGPYLPSMEKIAKICASADMLWDLTHKFNKLKQIPHAKGFCLACTFCEYQSDCPKFFGVEQGEWEQTFNELQKLKSQKDALIREVSNIENQIKQSIYPTEQKGRWIQAGQHRFKVAEQAGRKSFDKERMFEELIPIMGAKEAIALFAKCELESATSLRLYTQTIKN